MVVGQGDFILIRSPEGKAALVDAGPSNHVVKLRKERGITALDLVVASHDHQDHNVGMAEVIKAFHPRAFLATDSSDTTPHYPALLGLARDSGIQAVYPTDAARRISRGSVTLTVLAQAPEDKVDENDNSIGLRVLCCQEDPLRGHACEPRDAGIPTGGSIPTGFPTEAGPRPELGADFGLVKIDGDEPERTRRNVADAEGDLIDARGTDLAGGGTLDVMRSKASGPREMEPYLQGPGLRVIKVLRGRLANPRPGHDPGWRSGLRNDATCPKIARSAGRPEKRGESWTILREPSRRSWTPSAGEIPGPPVNFSPWSTRS